MAEPTTRIRIERIAEATGDWPVLPAPMPLEDCQPCSPCWLDDCTACPDCICLECTWPVKGVTRG